jgi:hypothetical protein
MADLQGGTMNALKIFSFSALILAASLALGQTGSILGTVTDKSGAVVQDAEVSVRNLATNLTRTTTSSTTGSYNLTSLAVGSYDVKATKAGFKTFKATGVTLTVDLPLTVNAQLEPGAVSEEVQVRADQLPPVDLESAQVSNLVDSRQMKDLPLIVRDPYSLVLLSPGTAQTNASGGFTVNGSRDRNNNFMLDGVDNNDTSVPGIPDGVLAANPDSTEEFRVITNNFNAEYGRNTGAIIDVVTKSGTNSFHGNGRWFGRYNGFGGARDWFNPSLDTSGQPQPMNPYVRNQFGYSIGGPIIKNKTFFFFDEEFDRFRTTLTNSVTAPTAAFRTGIFNYNNPLTGLSQPIDLTPTGANNAFGLPFDPTTQKIFALYPIPLQSADGISGTAFFPSSSQQNSYNATAKIDHNITSRHSVSLRYGYNHSFDPNPFHADILPGNVGGVSLKAISQGLSANLTSTLRSNLINSLVFGWNKIYANFACTGLSVLDGVSPKDAFGNGIDYLFDANITNFGCNSLVSDGQWRKTGTTSYTDTLTWVHGNHTFKFGADFRNIGEQGPDSFFSRRELTASTFINQTGITLSNLPNDPCFDPNIADCSLDNAAIALYGFMGNDFAGEFFNKSAMRQGTDNKHFRQHEYDWFGQDSWKIRTNLTLTLGLRYQLDGVPFEEQGNFSNLLADPGSFAQGQNVVMSVVGPGTGKQIYKQDYSNIEPRIGFSWDPWKDGKTAIRGAFGIFHDRVFGNLFGNARGNPPFEQDYTNNPFDTLSHAFGPDAFFPGSGFLPPTVPDTTPTPIIPDGSHLAPVLFDTHFRNSASNAWNFGIQRELPGNNTLDLSYVASKGTHIFRQRDGNPPNPALVAQLVADCTPQPNPFGCTPSEVSGILLYEGADVFGALPFNAVANNALVQPFYQQSVANSIYNSLQLKVTHRFIHGLQVQGSYTWSHAIDNSTDPLVPGQGNRTFPRNSLNLNQDRGNSDNDVRHIAVINYVWEIPLGRGKGYLNSGMLGRVFEGMQFSGITTAQTGFPFVVRCTRDSQRTGISAWCNEVGDPFASGTNSGAAASLGLKPYFTNPAAFTVPDFGGPGNIGRNHIYGPGYVNFNMVFAKKTKLAERADLEFRFECYNLFNHAHFQQPDNLQTDSTFGLISATVANPDSTTSARQVQVALKLNF